MNIPSNTLPRKLLIAGAVLAILLGSLACQLTTGLPAKAPSTAATTAPSTLQTGAAPSSAGASTSSLVPTTGTLGLDAFTSYRQTYTNSLQGTFQGKPYTSTTTIDRQVTGNDETSLVQSSSATGKSFYLQLTRL